MENEWERERKSEEFERCGGFGQPDLFNMDLDYWDWSAPGRSLSLERHFFLGKFNLF